MIYKRFISLAAITLLFTGCGATAETKKDTTQEVNNRLINQEDIKISMSTAIIKTSKGDITVEFHNESPKTVENFITLSKEGFYDNTKFHRVIDGFMIQGGDPLSKDDSKKMMWGTGGPDYKFEDEFNDHKLVAGSFAMANSGPNTNGSQFFIVTAPETPWLDGRHTNFGQVIEGMDVVDAIGTTETGAGDVPVEAIEILSIELQ